MLDFRKLWQDRTFRKVLLLFIIVKIVVFSAGVLGQLIPEEITHRQHRSDSPLLNPWAQHDAGAYIDIAKNGYNSEFNEGTGNYSWYPLYPLLIRLFSFMGYDVAAFLIANVASFLAIAVLYAFVKEKLKERAAYRSVFYLMLFPTAYFFTAMYTESLFLLLSLLCFWYARDGSYWKSGAFGFLAALTRAQGAILFLPVLYMYLNQRQFNIKKTDLKVVGIFLIPLGIIAFMLYHYAATGNALMQFQTQQQFGRSFSLFFWEPILKEVANMVTGQTTSKIYFAFSFSVWVCFLVLSYYAYKRLGKEFGIYMLVSLVMPFFTSSFFGITRFVLVLFPGFMVLAMAAEKDRRLRIFLTCLYVVFAVMLIVFTVRHVNEDIYVQPEQIAGLLNFSR